MAGFEVIIYGRFWVIAEVLRIFILACTSIKYEVPLTPAL